MNDTKKMLIGILLLIILLTMRIERIEDGITISFGILPLIKRLLSRKQ